MILPTVESVKRFEQIVGSANVLADAATLARYTIDEGLPAAALRPASADEVAEIVSIAAEQNFAVVPVGACTKLCLGLPPARYDLALDMSRLPHLAAYDPGDLTLSAGPAFQLSHLSTVLAAENQLLPLDVPFFEHGTIGGAIASGLSGPSRHMYGSTRDFLLGAEFVTGYGALCKSGGRVVKNVSGYDLHKLLIGSLGTLAILTKIHLRTFPIVLPRRTFVAGFRSVEEAFALRRALRGSPLSFVALDVLSSDLANALVPNLLTAADDSALCAEVAGNEAVLHRCRAEFESRAAEWRAATVETLTEERAREFWAEVRELPSRTAGPQSNGCLLKLSFLPEDQGRFLLRLAAHLPPVSLSGWLARGPILYLALHGSTAEPIAALESACRHIFALAAEFNAAITLQWAPAALKRRAEHFQDSRGDLALMKKVKEVFDPRNILSPGRFPGGL
jgi:glycolate oxidase FAD binding subunit